MEYVAVAAAAVVFGAWSVFVYRMGLGDGMRKERGIAPKIGREKKRKPTPEELEAARVAAAVERFK